MGIAALQTYKQLLFQKKKSLALGLLWPKKAGSTLNGLK